MEGTPRVHCRQCGQLVEPEREDYATPVCFACLPPPRPIPVAMRRGATISPCGTYRYDLTREWREVGQIPRWVCFVGLNPSTADERVDDPTIRREIGFARAMGATGLIKVNLFAYRATDPRVLVAVARESLVDACGPANWGYVSAAAARARSGMGLGVVAAWGALPRSIAVPMSVLAKLGRPLLCLGVTKDGSPRHPLYLPKTAMPMEWRP